MQILGYVMWLREPKLLKSKCIIFFKGKQMATYESIIHIFLTLYFTVSYKCKAVLLIMFSKIIFKIFYNPNSKVERKSQPICKMQ